MQQAQGARKKEISWRQSLGEIEKDPGGGGQPLLKTPSEPLGQGGLRGQAANGAQLCV